MLRSHLTRRESRDSEAIPSSRTFDPVPLGRMRMRRPATPLQPAERGIYSDLVTAEIAEPSTDEQYSGISSGIRSVAAPAASSAEDDAAAGETTGADQEDGRDEEAEHSGDGGEDVATEDDVGARGEEPTEEEQQDEEEETALMLRGGGAGMLGQAESNDGLVQVFERPTMPLPDVSPVRLPHEDLDVEISAPAYDAPRTLRHEPARGAEELSPELTGYADLFMQASSSAQRLYSDIIESTRRATSKARAEEGRRAVGRQMALDVCLAKLDAKLAEARLNLAASRDLCLAMLENRIMSAKSAIRRAAGGATGALRARADRIEPEITTQRGLATTIRNMPPNKRDEIERAKTAAWRGMDGLVSKPSTLRAPASGNRRPAMMRAKNEALALNIHFPVAEAKLELAPQVEQMKTGAMQQMPPAESSLCNAFCPFEDWKTMLRGEAVEKVGGARVTSLNRLKDTGREARENVVRTFDEAEKSLIEQHDAARKSLAESSSQRARGEREQAQAQAQGQASTLAAVAGAQPTAVKSIDRMIGDQAGGEENDFARSVISYAKGLLTNGMSTGRRQFARTIEGGERAAGRTGQASETANANFLKAASRSGDQLLASAVTTAQSAERSIEDTSKRMLRLVDPIRSTMEGFIGRVNSQFATQVGTLQSGLTGLQAKITSAYAGASSNDGNDTNTEHPPADTGAGAPASQCRNDCPAPPQPSETQSEGGERETTNAFIARLTGYGTDPQTERNIAQFIRTIPETVATDLSGRATRLDGLLGLGDSNPYGVLDELRGLTRKQAAAVEETYGGPGELRSDLDTYLNIGNLFTSPVTRVEAINAARAYLNGNTELGAVHELNIATHLWNDSERIDRVMQDLTPAQMRSMNANYGTALEEVRSDLNELDEQVFQDFRNERVGNALARRLRASIDEAREARGNAGADAAVDAIAASFNARGSSRLSGAAQFEGVEGARSREARQAQSWDAILTGFATIQEADPEDQAADSESRGRALIAYATAERTYDVYVQDDSNPYREHPSGHWETRREGVSAAQRRLIENLVRYGEGSAQARAARMVVEMGRPGGANPDRVRIATDDPELNAGVVDARTLRDAQDRQDEMYRLIQQYAPGEIEAGDEAPTVAQIRQSVASRLSAGVRNDPRQAAYLESLVTGNPDNPDSVIARLDYAMEGAGTSNDVLRQTLGTLTREQFEAVRERYDATHEPDLLVRLGIRGQGNWWDSETSGDTANDLEVLSLGIPRNDRERAEVAALRMHQQIDQAGWLGEILAGREHSRMEANYARLMSVMGADDVGFDASGNFIAMDVNGDPVTLGRFSESGQFEPPAGFSHEDLALAMTVGQISAENYKAATDRIADGIATALVVTAAIVTTALTGGAAASIWIPVLVTAAAGVASMGVKYAIKGGRYGSEEMMLDLASTIVQAATAGIGAAAGAALRGGSKAVGALATNMRLSEQALATAATGTAAARALPGLTFGQELFVGALSSGFAGGANAAINPDSYRSNHYAGDILHGIVRGSISGAAGAGITRGVTSGVNSLARSAGAASGAREALSRGASLDAAARLGSLRSRLYGTSALTEVGGRAFASGLSGMVTRGVELGYDRAVLNRRVSWSQAIDDLGAAFVQNLVQGFGEGAVDRMIRRYSATRRAEHDFTVRDDAADFRQRGREAMEAEARRMGLLPSEGRLEGGTPVLPSSTMAVDETGAMVPPALHHDDVDGTAPLRAAESEGLAGRRPMPEPANDNPGARPHQVMALSDVAMVSMPKAMEGGVFVHPDTRNLMAANDNFGRLINADPTREVAIHHNPVTGEYVVIQGGATSVAVILPGGEMKGPGASGRLVSVDGVPSPDGYWIVHSHFHPNRPGEAGTAMLRRLPSAFGGDFGVLHFEAFGLGLGDRSSRIYYSHEGRVAYTDFGIAPGHPEGKYWIDLPHPVTGERVRQHFHTPIEYNDFVAGVRANPDAAVTPRGGGHGALATADADTPAGALRRGSTETELGPADRIAVRDLASEIENLAEHRRAIDVLRENGASESTIAAFQREIGDAQARSRSMVEQMGLVGEPRSMDRLHQIMNDTDMSADLRQAIGDAVVSATREHMIRSGQLEPDEPLMLLFHGAPIGRARSMAAGGIDLARVGSGHGDDFGAGLYLTSGVANAETYAAKFGQERGAIFPFVMRRRDMGLVVDVRPGGVHRAAWEAFVVQNQHLFAEGVMTPGMMRAMREGRLPAFHELDGHGNRGQVFEAFLVHLSVATGDPTLARPDLVLGELGGPFTSGVGVGDQQAARTSVVADVLNSQMGSRAVPRAEPDSVPHPGVLRTDDVEESSTPQPPREDEYRPATPLATEATENVAGVIRDLAEGEETFASRGNGGAEEQAQAEVAAAARQAAEDIAAAAELSPIQRVPFEEADASGRLQQAREAIDHLRLTYPDQAMFLDGLSSMPEAMRDAAIRALFASQSGERAQAIRDFESMLRTSGADPDTARQALRNIVDFTNYMSERLLLSLRHVAERELWRTSFEVLPDSVRGLAQDSNLLHFVGAKHPDLLIELHGKFAAATPEPARQTTAAFEDFVSRALTAHKEVQAETVGRRTVRFDTIDDFNEAAARAAPNTRYEFERLAFTTDAEGRVIMAEGVPVRHRGRRERAGMQRDIGHSGDPGDVGFHLIAHIFNGPVNELNVIAGNGQRVAGDPGKNLNSSAYKVEFENIVRNILDNRDDIVEVQVQPVYDSGSRRPDRIKVRFRTDAGDWIEVPVFLNRPGGGR